MPPIGAKCTQIPLVLPETLQQRMREQNTSRKQKYKGKWPQGQKQQTIRKCRNCGRPCKGHMPPIGAKCTQIQVVSPVTLQQRMQEQHNARQKKYMGKRSTSKQHVGWSNAVGEPPVKVQPLKVYRLSEICGACGASMFPFEAHTFDGDKTVFSLCCANGSIDLPPYKDPPDVIQQLYIGTDSSSKNFREHIRSYNGALSLASKQITGSMFHFPPTSRGPPVFKMSGSMYHLMGPVLKDDGVQPKFSQLYVYDRKNEVENRLKTQKTHDKLLPETIEKLQSCLRENNFHVQQYEQAAEVMRKNPTEVLRLCFKAKGSRNVKKQYNLPDVNDVGILAPGDMAEKRDIVLYNKSSNHPEGNKTTRIHELHQMYDPTAYILLFPHGDSGYSIPAPLKVGHMELKTRKVSTLEFYRYHMMIRDSNFNTIHRAGRLFQEFLCDMYCKVESGRLRYIRNNQDTLRSERYSGLMDAISAAKDKGRSFCIYILLYVQKNIVMSVYLQAKKHHADVHHKAVQNMFYF